MRIHPLPSRPTPSSADANTGALPAAPLFSRPPKHSGAAAGGPGASRVRSRNDAHGARQAVSDGAPASTTPDPAQGGIAPANPGRGGWQDIARSVRGSASEFGAFVLNAPARAMLNHRSAIATGAEYALGAGNAVASVLVPGAIAAAVLPEMAVQMAESARGAAYAPAERENMLAFARTVLPVVAGGLGGGAFVIGLENHGVRGVNLGIESAIGRVGQFIDPPALRFHLHE